MSFSRSVSAALYRSIDQAKQSLSSAMRMDVVPQTTMSHGRLPLYALASEADLGAMALGVDADLGGKSTMKLEIDARERKGRFYGTLSNEVPRGAKLERSGYAGFRNRNRPTLFSHQTWDTTMHPLLRLRVRNRLAGPPSSATPAASLKSALSSSSTMGGQSAPSVHDHAIKALGLRANSNAPGPKFFVNIQTDGPVTSDLFQHRLWLDERFGDAWQDVIIPLPDFCLMNSGTASSSQLSMMREKIRTVGISVVLELPSLGALETVATRSTAGLPNSLQANHAEEAAAAAAATQSLRGSRRIATYNFDLGIERIEALTEDALQEEQEEAVYGKAESL